MVTVQRAENLINKDGFGSGLSDPYVKVHIRDKIGNIVGGGYKNTSVIQDNLNPEWNEMLVFEGITDPQTCTLYLEVFDEDYVLFFSSLAKHDELGKASVDLGTLANVDCFQDLKLQLTGEPFANSRLYIGLNTLGEWGKEEWGGL